MPANVETPAPVLPIESERFNILDDADKDVIPSEVDGVAVVFDIAAVRTGVEPELIGEVDAGDGCTNPLPVFIVVTTDGIPKHVGVFVVDIEEVEAVIVVVAGITVAIVRPLLPPVPIVISLLAPNIFLRILELSNITVELLLPMPVTLPLYSFISSSSFFFAARAVSSSKFCF